MNKAKRGMVSPLSLFFIFVICRIVICLTYIQSVSTGKLTIDMSISAMLALALTLILTIPAILCLKKNKNPLEIKWIRILYGAYFIFLSVVNVSRFSYFASTRLNPESQGWIFALMITIAASYAAYLGIEGLSRFSSFAFILIIGALFVILAFNITNFHIINVLPLFTVGTKELLSDSVIITGNTIEIALFLILKEKVNGKIIKPYIFSMIMSYIIIAVIFIFVCGVLGDSASLQAFPVYSLAQLASLGDFKRLDAVYMAFWIFAIFVKASILIYASTLCIKKYTHKTKCIVAGISSFALEAVFTMMLRPGNFKYSMIIIPFLIFSVIIPLLTLIFKKKDKGEKLIEKF